MHKQLPALLTTPFLAVGLTLALAQQPAHGQDAPTRSVIDQAGETVVVPARPRRIADLWFAHNEVLIMLGAGSSIAVTVDRPQTSPWMFRVAPALNTAIQLRTTTPNPEAMLAAKVDLAFVANSLGGPEALRRIGIPTVSVAFTDAASLIRCLDVTASVLGTDHARAIATLYASTLTDTVGRLRAVTDRIDPTARPRVLHIGSLSPLEADGARTVIDDWIGIAGGRNAATGLTGNKQPISLEQIVAWDPDVIILGADAGPFDAAHAPGLWQSLRAVRDGHVIRNPAGVYDWDRYASEYMLQLSWTAKTLHPDLFRDIDMVALTRRFYADFFAYSLSAADATRMIEGLPPA